MKGPLNTRLQSAFAKRPIMVDLLNPSATKTDLFSNDYLSLSCDSRLRSQVLGRLAAEQNILGSGGSRILDGNTSCHVALESRLRRYYDVPAALVFNSGYDANISVFGTLPQARDIVVYDELIHASALDGMRTSRAAHSLYPFKHNSVASLKVVLQNLVASMPAIQSGSATVFVAFETVYSMDGDIAPAVALVETVEQILPKERVQIVVDEAHSTGLYGPSGRGLISHYGLEQRVDIRLHTFGKALASTGAVVLSSPLIRAYLINFARAFIFTTALSRLCIISTEASLDIIESRVGDELRERLFRLSRHARELVIKKLSSISSGPLRLPPPSSTGLISPIIPLVTPRAVWLASELRRQGWATVPIIPPAVPSGEERIRLIIHAANTEKDIEEFVGALVDCLRKTERESVITDMLFDAQPVAKL